MERKELKQVISTFALVKEVLQSLCLPIQEGLAIPGVDGTLTAQQPGPTVVVMGELDSVVGWDSSVCDPNSDAAHLCGHHIQVASMLGTAMGLIAVDFASHASGRVKFLGVPADVRMETYVRGRTVDAIISASRKVDRALRADGDAVGSQTRIRNIPGYLTFSQDTTLTEIARQNSKDLLGEEGTHEAGFLGGSFDVGDLAHLMLVLHPFVGEVHGSLHAADFSVVEFYSAAILPAKLMAMTMVDLLYDEAQEARQVIDKFEPALTKDKYLKVMDELGSSS